MVKNMMIDAVFSPLASEQRTKLSFSVGNIDKMSNNNYLYMGHEGEKERTMREEFRAIEFTDF